MPEDKEFLWDDCDYQEEQCTEYPSMWDELADRGLSINDFI